MTGSTVELDALCRPGTATGTRVAAFNAIHPDTAELFAAVLSGDFTITGFVNTQKRIRVCASLADAQARLNGRDRAVVYGGQRSELEAKGSQ